MAKQITRRTFLSMSALAVGTTLAACAQPAAPAPATSAPKAAESTKAPAAAAPTAAPAKAAEPTKASAAAASKYKEAPMLAEMVKAGKLPAVELRLPKDPQLYKPLEEVGKYGGTLRMGSVENSFWSITCLRTVGLFRYNQFNTQVLGEQAKSYKFSPDGKTFTIELREGQKWSDGSPFTVDDLLFWWEDVQNNTDLTPSPDKFWRPGGTPAVFKKVSNTVIDIVFASPYPVVLDRLARSAMSSDANIFGPKEYLKKWHLKHNDKANDVAKEEKYDDWKKAFSAHWNPFGGTNMVEPGRPVLWMWQVENKTSERITYVRNPYFPGVDTEGNQLPYIDKVDAVFTGNKEVQILKASGGEFDFEVYYIGLKDMAVLKQNEQKGNFRILMPQSLRTSQVALMPNRTVPDPILNELFNNKKFRIALSHSINRKAINDTLYFGLGKPFAAVCHPGFSFFKPEWGTMYIEYDVAKANALLDEIGLKEKDAQGFRLRKDGKGRISLMIEIGSAEGPKQDVCEMVKKDWEKIGIESNVKFYEGTLYNQRHAANELQVGNWHLDRAGLFGRGNPLFFGWDEPSQQRWGGQWALWFSTNGKEGKEPPQEIKDHKALMDKWRETAIGTPEFDKLGAEYHKYFAEEIPMIGTTGFDPYPLVVNNKLRNVPEKDIAWGSDTNFYAPYEPAQWFFKA